MTDFSNTPIKDLFGGWMMIDNSNDGIDATLRVVQDGKGTESPLYLSSSKVKIKPSADSASVFEVQDKDGNSILTIDTTNNKIIAASGVTWEGNGANLSGITGATGGVSNTGSTNIVAAYDSSTSAVQPTGDITLTIGVTDLVKLMNNGSGDGGILEIAETSTHTTPEANFVGLSAENNNLVRVDEDGNASQILTADGVATPDVGVKYDGISQYSGVADDSALESIEEIEFIVDDIDTSTTQEIATLGTNLDITQVSGTVTLGSGFANTSIYVNNELNGTLEDGFNLIQLQFDAIDFSSAKFATDGTNYGDTTILKIKPYNLQSSTTVLTARWNNGKPLEFVEPFATRGASNDELVINTDFESDTNGSVPADWTPYFATVTGTFLANSSSPISGSMDANLKVTTVGTDSDRPQISWYFANGVETKAGKTYRLEFDYKVNSGTCKIANWTVVGTNAAEYKGVTTLTGSGHFSQTITLEKMHDDYVAINFDGTNLFDVQLDNFSFKDIGNVADWDFTNGGATGVIDGSGNGNHLQHYNSPIVLNSEVRRDVKITVTGNTALSDEIPASHKLKSIIVEETAGNAVTINIGSSSGASDIVSGANITANDITNIEANYVGSLTDATDMYISSSAWNSASINLILIMEKI